GIKKHQIEWHQRQEEITNANDIKTTPKTSAVVIITSIIGEHNHHMQPDIVLYAPKYKKLPLEIMEKIEFYITKGNMGSKQILPLLITEFADHIINPRDLYNAVQKF
ncbi:24873_t:CDS:2, partial [Gigaspora rosea]